MDNFYTFDKKFLEHVVGPFIPGVDLKHITPISYFAYTPDIFLFLFRTTNPNGEDFYFVSVQFDCLSDENRIADIIKEWIGVEPIQAIATAETDELKESNRVLVLGDENDKYKRVMILVPRPEQLGYWSDNIVINQGDDIDKVMKDFTEKDRRETRKLMAEGGETRSVSVYKCNEEVDFFYND